jgi:hypothetical protein
VAVAGADPPFVGDLDGMRRLLEAAARLGDLSAHTASLRARLDSFPFEGELKDWLEQRVEGAHGRGQGIEEHRRELLSLLPRALGQLEQELQDFVRQQSEQHGP